jgi:hypothetical protein
MKNKKVHIAIFYGSLSGEMYRAYCRPNVPSPDLLMIHTPEINWQKITCKMCLKKYKHHHAY